MAQRVAGAGSGIAGGFGELEGLQFESSAVVGRCRKAMDYLGSRLLEVASAEDHLVAAVDFGPGIPYNLAAMELRHIQLDSG